MWSVSAPVTRSSYARDIERAQAAERSDLIRRWGCKVRRSASLAGVVVRDRRDSRFLPLRSSRFQKRTSIGLFAVTLHAGLAGAFPSRPDSDAGSAACADVTHGFPPSSSRSPC